MLLAGFMLFGVILMAFDTLVLGFFMFTSALSLIWLLIRVATATDPHENAGPGEDAPQPSEPKAQRVKIML